MVPKVPGRSPGAIVRLPEELETLHWVRSWRILRRNWELFVLLSFGGLAAAILSGALQTPIFHASSTIEIQGITDGFLKQQDGNPNAGADSEVLDIQTQIRIIQSDSLVQPVAARLAYGHASLQSAILRASRSLIVRPAGQTRIIEIAADSTDPKVAADFVNALGEEFITQHIEARWQGSQRAAEKLKHALEDVRGKLEQSEQALRKQARDSGLFLNTDRSSVSEDKLRLVQEELSRAEADRVLKQSRYEAVARAAPADLNAILEGPATEASRAKLTDLRRQLAEYATTYTAGYSKVKRLEVQITPLETAIANETVATVHRIRTDFEQARQREAMLQSAYRAQTLVVSSDAENKVRYDVLRHEVDSTRALYDTMLARVKEAGIAATMRGSNVRVLDSAKAPVRPYRPDFAQLSLLGLLAGVFFAGIVLTVHDQTDRTIQSPGELQTFLDLPELGVIPPNPGLEPFRSIAASLRLNWIRLKPPLATPPGCNARVLAIVSARQGEGRSTITARLASALADSGKRVLMIDGDLRSPALHVLLSTPNENGLAEVLATVTPPTPTDLTRLLRKTSHTRVELLTAGKAHEGSPDLLYSPRLNDVLTCARNIFDIILIDTPPLLQTSDARIVGRASDEVIFVTRAAKTTRDDVLAVARRFAEDNMPMVGCILNDWKNGSRANSLRLRPNVPEALALTKHTSA